MITLPHYVQWVLQCLERADKEAFLVGGCIRDMLMERDIHDYDITTNALPEAIICIFEKENCKVIPTGIKHGTISISFEQNIVEITTYRIEQSYIQHRKPSSVTYTNDLIEDLKRRDFTMNAIAYAPDIGFIDPFQGMQDIKHKLVRCVGVAKERFEEDALRILRAIRFIAELHFTLDDRTAMAIKETASTLSYISPERINSEFHKILLADMPDTLTFLKDYHVLDVIIPDYSIIYDYEQPTPWHIYNVFKHTDIALNHTKNYPLESKLAIVFHDLGKPYKETFDENGIAHYKEHANVSQALAKNYMKDMHYSNKMITKVCKLIQYHDYYVIPRRNVLRKFLTKLDNDTDLALQVLDVQLADDYAKNLMKSMDKIRTIEECKKVLIQMKQEKDHVSMKDLAINGHDLIDLGLSGKQIGEMLAYVYHIVLDQPMENEKEKLLELIKNNVKK